MKGSDDVAERPVAVANVARLTDREYLWLVYDDGLVIPAYPVSASHEGLLWSTPPTHFEWELHKDRLWQRPYDEDTVPDAVLDGVRAGHIALEYVQLSYERGARA